MFVMVALLPNARTLSSLLENVVVEASSELDDEESEDESSSPPSGERKVLCLDNFERLDFCFFFFLLLLFFFFFVFDTGGWNSSDSSSMWRSGRLVIDGSRSDMPEGGSM